MADAGAGRNDAEILECLLAPLEEAVAFAIALIFQIDIVLESQRVAEIVHDDRMVDDEINGNERIDLFRVAAERLDAVAHRSQIHHGGNAGEVLHQHARRAIGDFSASLAAVGKPLGDIFDVRLLDGAVVLEAEQVLKQNLHGERKTGNACQAVLFGFRQAVIDIFLAPTERVLRHLKLSICDTAFVLHATGRKTRTNASAAFQGRAKVRVQSFPLSVPKLALARGIKFEIGQNGFHADRWRGSSHIESFLKRFQTDSREFGPLRRNVAICSGSCGSIDLGAPIRSETGFAWGLKW